MKTAFYRTLLVSLGILFICLWANAQIRESGVIQGNVTDDQGSALAGVTITIESPSLIGGPQSKTTDADGFYKFPALAVGKYKVTAKITGFTILVNEDIDLHAGFTLTVDFKMKPSTMAEEVEVVAVIPTVDIKSTKAGTVVMTDDLLLSIPVNKSYSGIMLLAPGDDYYSPYGGGYGSTSSWQFDGVDVSNPFWGGISFMPDFNVIKEATVIGLGLPAEYGRFTGAVMTAVTKSGSNKFSTLNEFWYQGKKWNSQNKGGIPANEWYNPAIADEEFATNPNYDIGLQLSGKLIQDKLWFFASGEYNRNEQTILGRDTPQITKQPKIFGKLTFQLNNTNKMDISATWYNQKTSGGGSYNYPQDLWRVSEYPAWYTNFNWTSIFSPTTFLDFKFGHYKYEWSSYPSYGLDIAGGYDYITQKYTQITTYSANKSHTYDLNVQLNHYISELFKGSHDLKFGAQAVHKKIVTEGGAPGNFQVYYYDGVPYRRNYVPIYSHDNYSTVFTGFAQDTWTVTKKLALNLGLRYDHYWYRIPTPNRGVVYSKGGISPRIGFTYDLLGDRKNIIKAHYSHYYEDINRNQFYSRFDPRRFEGSYVEFWDEATQEWAFGYAVTYPDVPASVDPNVSHPWIREITLGFERELFRDASIAINLYNRSIGKSFYAFNMAAVYIPETTVNPGPDGRVGTEDDQGSFTAYATANPGVYDFVLLNPKEGYPDWMTEDPKWYARGIEFIFTKRFSNRWQMIASYQYTVSKGNTSGAMVQIYDPNYLINAYGEQGGSYYCQPHQFKIQGNVLLPLDINLGVSARAMSGMNLVPTFYARLSSGSTRIAAEPPGKIKTDSRYDFDLRVAKVFRLQGVRLELMGNIFNVLNNHDGNNGITVSYGSYYGLRTSIKTPRTFIVGMRITY